MGWKGPPQAFRQVRIAKDVMVIAFTSKPDYQFPDRMAPASKGLGYGMLIISFLVVIYYNMIIAWTLFYTVAGLSAELPWQYCGNTTLTRWHI